jgi:exopolysaccharide biosynthesis polyprenyl glycosylphosphotransferase
VVTPDGAFHGDYDAPTGSAIARSGSRRLRSRLLVGDIATVAAAWITLGAITVSDATPGRRWAAALTATVVTLAAMQLLGLYRSRLCVHRGQEVTRIILAVLAGQVTFSLIRGSGSSGHGSTFLAAATCAVALIVFRWIFGQWLCAQRARGRHLRGIVMIGTNDDAAEVFTMLRSQPELGYEVRGVIGDEARSRPDWAGLHRARSLDELPELAHQTDATGVLVVANALSGAEVNRVIELSAATGLHVQVCPGFRGLATRRVRSVPMSGEAFLYLEPERRPTWQLAAKRVLDFVGAALGVVVIAPILLLVCAAIKLEDKGPALFRQVRIGLDGRPFVVFKLRSMVLDADKEVGQAVANDRTDGPLFKSANDPRITRVGSIIRALSIDELPQLLNVLTGSMSLVGPRPALAAEVDQFDRELLRRHCVKPGMTGLWQVEARDNPSFHTYRRLDLFYVDNWSIGLDLVILLTTVPMLLAHALRVQEPLGAPLDATVKA